MTWADHDLPPTRAPTLWFAPGTEIQALAFTAEASRAYLTHFYRVGGSVESSSTDATVLSVTTARVRPDRASGWSPRGH